MQQWASPLSSVRSDYSSSTAANTGRGCPWPGDASVRIPSPMMDPISENPDNHRLQGHYNNGVVRQTSDQRYPQGSGMSSPINGVQRFSSAPAAGSSHFPQRITQQPFQPHPDVPRLNQLKDPHFAQRAIHRENRPRVVVLPRADERSSSICDSRPGNICECSIL
mmetsp:Transcript_416/g.842  ORF Transcript_416/g.842 Transcript_416/m.842 type:complete len:165 (-) Transcript_416:70-564(-)